MRFLIDENVRKDVVDFLKSAGHDVLTVAAGSQDGKIAQTAQEEQKNHIDPRPAFCRYLDVSPAKIFRNHTH